MVTRPRGREPTRSRTNKQLTADLAAARATVTQLQEHISSVERRYDQLMAKVDPPAKPTRTRRRKPDEEWQLLREKRPGMP